MPPLVSILIPAYNAQAWISDTIKSALGQTWPRKELIIVDDGSTDETFNIARQYGSTNVKIISQDNMGGCAARNRALKECQGDYIQWLDADDLLAPDKIKQQLISAGNEANHDVLMSSAWGTFYYRPRQADFRPSLLWQDLGAVDWLIFRFGHALMMPVSAWLASRRLTELAGPWDERLLRNQDGEFFCRMVSLSKKVMFVAESRFYYRKGNAGSITRSWTRRKMESHCLSFELEVGHLLARERSERTISACVKRLNYGASLFEDIAPNLAGRLRRKVLELGGEITNKEISRKYALIRKMIGKRKAQIVKNTLWKTSVRLSCVKDQLLGKVFGTEL
jgi:glycosyltransferase involved in cell wall biosynthesis